jgi:hypothetical protein
MINYKWQIAQMDRLTEDGFVVTVHYRVSATEDNYVASTYGTVGFSEQPEGGFVPFEQLTEEMVIGWVQGSLGKDAVEASLASQIEAQKAPKQVSGLPWYIPYQPVVALL